MSDVMTDSPLCDGDPLARELAALLPSPTAVTPASVLFAAGEQSARAKANHWRTATIAISTLFVASWTGMAMRSPAMTAPHATDMVQTHTEPKFTPSVKEPEPVLSKPIPQLLVLESLSDELADERARGVRLRNDILAGGIGLIPLNPLSDPRLPSTGFFDSNRAVLGGYYQPKKSADE